MSELAELSDQQYRDLGVMPMSQFPADHRYMINQEAASAHCPKRWHTGEFTRHETRAWFEWHVRRSGDPRKNRPGISPALRSLVLARDGMICGICGGQIASRAELHIDHIKPWSKGGPTTLGNLQATHAACNMKKGARV